MKRTGFLSGSRTHSAFETRGQSTTESWNGIITAKQLLGKSQYSTFFLNLLKEQLQYTSTNNLLKQAGISESTLNLLFQPIHKLFPPIQQSTLNLVLKPTTLNMVFHKPYQGKLLAIELGSITPKDKDSQLDQNQKMEQEPKYKKRNKLWKHIQCPSLNESLQHKISAKVSCKYK